MRLIEINNEEKIIIIDGLALKVDFEADENVTSIHWDESVNEGFVKVKNGRGHVIKSMADYSEIIRKFSDLSKETKSTEYYLRIVCDDSLVDVNGVAYQFDFDIDPNYHAVYWDGSSGVIETKTGRNISLINIDEFSDIVSKHISIHKDHENERKALEEEYKSPKNVIKREIIMLENQITPRRLREAVLTQDGADWLNGQEGLIEQKRNELSALAE